VEQAKLPPIAVVRSHLNLLRWLLMLPLALTGYVVAVLLAVALSSLVTWLCPPELMISGMCTASWYSTAEIAALSVASAIGAVLFVVVPALIAPSHSLAVALVSLLAGGSYVAWFVLQVGTSFIVPAGSAVAAGMVATWLVSLRKRR
jgi:hypothetical protein